MRTVPLAALILLTGLSAQAAANDGPDYATGLQAALDDAGVRLTWEGGEAGELTYTVLRDGAPIAVVNDLVYVDELPQPQSVYAVMPGTAGGTISSRVVALSCPLSTIGVISTPPFVAVALHENCVPGVGVPNVSSLVEARYPGFADSEMHFR